MVSLISSLCQVLEGWLEKKAAGAIHLGSSWHRRYCKVDESRGLFVYFHKPGDKAADSVDLKLIQVNDNRSCNCNCNCNLLLKL